MAFSSSLRCMTCVSVLLCAFVGNPPPGALARRGCGYVAADVARDGERDVVQPWCEFVAQAFFREDERRAAAVERHHLAVRPDERHGHRIDLAMEFAERKA